MTSSIWVRGIAAAWLGIAPGCRSGSPIDEDDKEEGGEAEGGEGEVDDGVQDSPEANVGESDLRRLSAAEYARSIRALFGDAIADAAAAPMSILPSDRQDHGYASMVRGVTAAHLEAYFQVATSVGALVAASPDARAHLDPCLVDGDDSCLDDAIAGFGRRVFRRPLDGDELAALRLAYDEGLVDGHEAGVEDLIVAALLSPPFLYKVESGKAAPVDGLLELTDYELATRLSFLAWGGPPDDALLDAAEAGQLETELGMAEQVDRLFDDPRAAAWREQFFDELFGLDRLPTPPNDEAFLDGVELEGLPDAMRAEVQRFLAYIVNDQRGGFDDLMRSPIAFIESDALAEIYGVASGDAISLPEDERAGLLTRAAFLVGTQRTTAPIERGARTLERALCLELAPPDPASLPPGVELEEPPFDPDRSARQRWTDTTSAPACMGCHDIINPVGFAMEGYDSVGRHRETERLVDPEGQVVGALPVDAAVSLVVDGVTVDVDGLVELSGVLGGSDMAAACFAAQWFRFAHGRREAEADRKHLDALAAQVIDGVALDTAMRQLATQPEFRLRRVGE